MIIIVFKQILLLFYSTAIVRSLYIPFLCVNNPKLKMAGRRVSGTDKKSLFVPS